MDIKCRKTSCRFNDALTCKAHYVGITDSTACKSFVYGGEEKDISARMFESAPEFANSRHIREVNLDCKKTGCLFNSKCKCCANGITVLDEHNVPKCGTFIKEE